MIKENSGGVEGSFKIVLKCRWLKCFRRKWCNVEYLSFEIFDIRKVSNCNPDINTVQWGFLQISWVCYHLYFGDYIVPRMHKLLTVDLYGLSHFEIHHIVTSYQEDCRTPGQFRSALINDLLVIAVYLHNTVYLVLKRRLSWCETLKWLILEFLFNKNF